MADSIKTPEMAALDNGLYDSISRVSDAMRGFNRGEKELIKNANSKEIEYRSEKNLGQNKKS